MGVQDVLADAWLQVALAGSILVLAVIVGSVMLRRSKDEDKP